MAEEYDKPAKVALCSQIEDEIRQYITGTVNISEGVFFSQKELVRRIGLFESHTYPTGKFDSQGNYKYWFDLITPRVEAEVKNIDFDTKDVTITSDRKIDDLTCLIVNLKLKEWMRQNGQGEEINTAIEAGSGYGNVVWKKVKGAYERMDFKNLYVINQTVETLEDTPVIERHQMSQSELRAYAGIWGYVQETIDNCGVDSYKSTIQATQKQTTVPYYDIYERNGEVKLSDLKEAQNIPILDGDDKKYVLAKVVAAGKAGSGQAINIDYILFAEDLGSKKMCDIYKEYHRSRYKGRWFREGLIELMFDLQVRANQIGNQLAQGLEWSSKTIFKSNDKLIVQNILSDLKNGDIIRTEDLQQVPVRMEGFDQLIADWNRIIDLADSISNASAIVMGEIPKSGMSFRIGSLANENAMKLYQFVRQKLGIPLSEIFQEWILPEIVADLQTKDVLRLTGDPEMMDRLNAIVVQNWYLSNLVIIGPHSPEFAQQIQAEKLTELQSRPHLLMENVNQLFDDFKGEAVVDITGESTTIVQDMATLAQFIGLEQDPVRRSAMIELAMKKSNIDVDALPKSSPDQLNGAQPGQPMQQEAPPDQDQQQQAPQRKQAQRVPVKQP